MRAESVTTKNAEPDPGSDQRGSGSGERRVSNCRQWNRVVSSARVTMDVSVASQAPGPMSGAGLAHASRTESKTGGQSLMHPETALLDEALPQPCSRMPE